MNDKIRLLMPCEIPNLEKYVDIALIESELETYIKTLVPKIYLQDLVDWNLFNEPMQSVLQSVLHGIPRIKNMQFICQSPYQMTSKQPMGFPA